MEFESAHVTVEGYCALYACDSTWVLQGRRSRCKGDVSSDWLAIGSPRARRPATVSR